MGIIAVTGVVLVLSVLADLTNTLVTTTTAQGRFWLTRVLYVQTWTIVRRIGHLFGKESRRESL